MIKEITFTLYIYKEFSYSIHLCAELETPYAKGLMTMRPV